MEQMGVTMGTIALLLAWGIGALIGAAGAMHALVLALRPLLVRLLPDDMFGPDGMYIDTAEGQGIFDVTWLRRRA